MSLVERLWEAVVGTPYYTTRVASVEFGPTPAARRLEAAELAKLREAQRVECEQAERDGSARGHVPATL